MTDPRKEALKEGLRQLQSRELQRLIDHINSGKPLLLDRDEEGNANYSDGAYCPLAIAVGVDEWISYINPLRALRKTSSAINGMVEFLLTESQGYKIYNTRGIQGEFYTTNRREDLLLAAEEVLEGKL